MDRPTKPSGRHAVRLRWDEIITRLSYRFNFLAIRPLSLTFKNLLTHSANQLETLTHHCDIVETGNDSWRFKSRDDDQTTRARTVSATPASSDGASATGRTRRSKGSLLGSDSISMKFADGIALFS